ncbi:helix-turn-helix domain-containing protein [Qipengyuania gaetbuli]|uniref:helix-turn-helix domain-containing protein n=1 Tax=Qipengyuania gaetbuli TaxID=266952 RepID=UPI001CD5B91A|nr:helix-turn-helix domain-containing protein [Qipengyuania gaetbuli]MCA0909104.1 helix-turn-helix domain-containing protein [Qipengyuania gaetbuli]
MMTFAEQFDRFAQLHLPAHLGDDAILRFRSLARPVDAARDVALGLDEGSDHLVFVSSGAIKLVAHASAGRNQVVAFHFPDELVVVPARAEHSYTLSTLRKSDLLVFDYASFADLARGDPAVLRSLLDTARRSLSRSREKSLTLGRKTATERLASFLVGMAHRIGVEREGLTFIDLPMSRRDIADSLGLTIETVSRQFTILRDLGIVRTVGKSGVQLVDLRALEARAGYLTEAA